MLRPIPFEHLLARALAEIERERSAFDLPRRSFWRAPADLDLGVTVHGERAANPAGPAAGPHTQLSQNLVLGWLAGARVLELKTVQVRDRLEIPRPCIDAPDLGFNVEWSQELALEDSIEQYVSGWLLIHVLRDTLGLAPAAGAAAVFQASVGYDLAGVRSEGVARFLDSVRDCAGRIAALRGRLPPSLRRRAEVDVPARMVRCVTLSTFHGCPPGEIESIALHLFERHALDVVVKLNPTLLGYAEVDDLLRGTLGYREIGLDRGDFERDLGWGEAVEMLDRLAAAARRLGRRLGVKLTNTLIIRNHRRRLGGERVYLSGPPLHPLAVLLAERLAHAVGELPLSFSAGIDAENFADAVACGFAPVTSCTDLLKPTGYRRLPRYLKALEAALRESGATTIGGFILARARNAASGPPAPPPAAPGAGPAAAPEEGAAVRAAALANLGRYARAVVADPRYRAEVHRAEPRRVASRLSLFDCASCNACVVVCPNDAMFVLRAGPLDREAPVLRIADGAPERRPGRFVVRREEQWAVFADACNACGNCDTFCPEHGGPFQAKPRFHGSLQAFEADASDGLVVLEAGRRVLARLGGTRYEWSETPSGARFGDGAMTVTLDSTGEPVEARRLGAGEGPCAIPLERAHAIRLLRDAALAGVNPVSAPWLERG